MKYITVYSLFFKNNLVWGCSFAFKRCTTLLLPFNFCLLSFAFSQSLPPPITNYTTRDYQGFSQNWAVVQNRQGIMFFANGTDVLEYDGTRWKHHPTAHNNESFSLAIDIAGIIYVGARGEFGYLAPAGDGTLYFTALSDSIGKVRLPDSLRSFGPVWYTHVVNKKVFFNANDFMFVWDGDHLSVIFPQKRFFKSHVVDDALWVKETGIGLFTLDPADGAGKFTFVEGSEFFADKGVHSILPYNTGNVLIATRRDGLYIFSTAGEPAAVRFHTTSDSWLLNQWVYGGAKLSYQIVPNAQSVRNDLYAFNTTTDGLFITNAAGNVISQITRSSGLQNETIFYIYEDTRHGLWLVLDNGISRTAPFHPLRMMQEGKTYKGKIQAITRHSDAAFSPGKAGKAGNASLYLATSQGVFRLNDQTISTNFASHSFSEGRQRSEIKGITGYFNDLLSTKKGLLATGSNSGTFLIEDSKAKNVSKVFAYALCLLRKEPLTVAVGGRNGLALLQYKKKWHQVLHIPYKAGLLKSEKYINDDIISLSSNHPQNTRTSLRDRQISKSPNQQIIFAGLRTRGVLHITFSPDLNAIHHYPIRHGSRIACG